MDTQLLWSIFDQCCAMGLKEIIFSGGEPMLHPCFLDAVDHANRNGWRTKILSNLTLLNDAIINRLKTWLVHEVQASLYSVDPVVHDAITKKPGSCELTKKGIRELTNNNIPVFISCPITKLNKNSYSAVLEYARSLGLGVAPNNIIMAQSNGDTKNLAYRLDIDEAVNEIKDILDNDDAYDAERFLPGYRDADNALPCVQDVCKNFICINAQGKATPSPGWHKVLGNLSKQSLQTIWEQTPETENVRNIGMKDFPQCVSCPDIQFCGMSLEGNVNENPDGNPFIIPRHICETAKATRLLVHSQKKKKKGA
jgi:MoaA/NifB/PqqE/SkfB family radical SAM enzyme